MDKYLKYDYENNVIEQVLFNKTLTAKTESMMALGNGYLGLRSVDEEVESFNKEDLLINGIFNKDVEEEVAELANASDSIQTSIYIDGELFSISKRDKYSKKLFIENGYLERRIEFTRKLKSFEFVFKRFVSQDTKNIYAQKIVITQTKGTPAVIIVEPKINGQTTNRGTQHFSEGHKKRPNNNSVNYLETTTLSKRIVNHNMFLIVKNNNKKLKSGNDDFVLTMARRQVGFKIKETLSLKKPFTIEKLMSVNTSIDKEDKKTLETDVINKGRELLVNLESKTFNILLKESNAA
jgi:hypothetical glycosyl hydrolase